MSREAQGGTLLLVGVVALRLTLTGGHMSYVKAGLGILLVISSVVLVAIGLGTLWLGGKRDPAAGGHDTHADGEHAEHAGPRVGWLVLVPFLAFTSIAPNPLGAYAAGLQEARLPLLSATSDFSPLPEAVDGAVPLGIRDFVARAIYDEKRSVEGVRVRLVGFVTHDPTEPGSYLLTRFMLNCCAADATPVEVAIHDGGSVIPPPDTWLEIEGTLRAGRWEPESLEDVALPTVELDAASVRAVERPDQPYEY